MTVVTPGGKARKQERDSTGEDLNKSRRNINQITGNKEEIKKQRNL